MFEKWFGTRTRRASERSNSFRPELEYLEGRLAPSSFMPMDDKGKGDDKGPDDDRGGPPGHFGPGPGPVSTISTDANHSFNGSTITDSFNNTINNTIILMPAQQSAVGNLFALSGLLAGALNNPQLGSLINDEIALAVDKYLDALPGIANTSLGTSLTNDISTLQSAINANPLENTPVGSAIGMLAFNVTTAALTAAQPTI